MNKAGELVKIAGGAIDSVVNLLPPKWASWVRKSRKAIVSLAGAIVSVTALGVFPDNVWLAGASAVASAIVTYWVPNEPA